MRRQIQQIIIFSILALISYAIWTYYFNKESINQKKPFTKGYSVKNIELRITDKTGQMTAKFTSPSIIRYTDSPVIFINSPLFWTYDAQGKEHWLMKSNKAEYNAEKDEVGLYDNLIAKTINDESETSFKADNILLNLKSKQAHTSDGIILIQQQFTMTGQIAKFDLENEILEVNNNVKAIYATKH